MEGIKWVDCMNNEGVLTRVKENNFQWDSENKKVNWKELTISGKGMLITVHDSKWK